MENILEQVGELFLNNDVRSVASPKIKNAAMGYLKAAAKSSRMFVFDKPMPVFDFTNDAEIQAWDHPEEIYAIVHPHKDLINVNVACDTSPHGCLIYTFLASPDDDLVFFAGGVAFDPSADGPRVEFADQPDASTKLGQLTVNAMHHSIWCVYNFLAVRNATATRH